MVYSSGSNGVFQTLRSLYTSEQEQHQGTVKLVPRRLETSEPQELNARYLELELGEVVKEKAGGGEDAQGSGTATPVAAPEERKFAKPRGPARRAR